MPKPFSKRLDAVLAAYKGKKPQKAKVTPITSPYGGVEEAEFSGPFGSGKSGFETYTNDKGQQAKRISTDMTLAPQLQTAGETAMGGLNSNLGYINRSPQEQVAFATGGSDPYYNVLKEQSDRALQNNIGRARLNALKTGGSNSTALGGALGTILNDDTLRQNQILQSSLQFGNQQATQNAGTNLGAIGNLASLVYPLGSAANAQLNTSLQDQGRAQAATAQAINAAEANYTSAMNQYRANERSWLEQGIGTTLALAGAAAGVMGAGGAASGLSNIGANMAGTGGTQYSQAPYTPQPFTGNYGSATPLTPNYGIPGYNFGAVNPRYASPDFTNLSVA